MKVPNETCPEGAVWVWDVLSGVAKMAWDVMSGVTITAWDVMSGVTKTAWHVLSMLANLCGMFCPGCQKWHGMFCLAQVSTDLGTTICKGYQKTTNVITWMRSQWGAIANPHAKVFDPPPPAPQAPPLAHDPGNRVKILFNMFSIFYLWENTQSSV